MSVEAPPDIQAVRNHLVTHLGAPDDVIQVNCAPDSGSAIQALEIGVFAPGGADAPVVLATCGVSQVRQPDGRRVEAVMVVRGLQNNDLANALFQVLGNFALFVDSNPEGFGLGDVIRSADDVRQFSLMDALAAMPPAPFVDALHSFERDDGDRVELLWLLPVYDDEADYVLEHGPAPMMMTFAAQGLDLTQLDRDEANTMISPEDAADLAKMREVEELKRQQTAPAAAPQRAPRGPAPSVSNEALAAFQQDDGLVMRRRSEPEPKPERAPRPRPEPRYEPEYQPEPEPESDGGLSPGAAAKKRRARQAAAAGSRAPRKKKVVRFELPPERRRQSAAEPEPEEEPAPEPVVEAPELSPAEAKKKRIAALKAQARARADAAKQRDED